jgi:hypothetical protein
VHSVFGKINYGGLKHNSLHLGLVLPSGGWQSLFVFFLRMMLTHFKSIHNWLIWGTKFNNYKIIKRGKFKMSGFNKSWGGYEWNHREAEKVAGGK